MLWTVAVYGRVDFNVALNRPTFAISECRSPAFGTFSSSKAVDGNKDNLDLWKLNNSCFRSEDEDNPWWAVDLGAAVAVVGVLFTNRRDGGGNVSTRVLAALLHGTLIGLFYMDVQ